MFEAFQPKVPSPPLVIVEPSLRHDMDDIVHGLWPGQKLAVVDDKHTAEAAGDKIFKSLKSRFECRHVTFPGSAAANDEAYKWLSQESTGADALVAVGSGSINDVCKYVSFKAQKPYLSIPTAASMNGYVSANASIKIQGYKTTLPAHMPEAVLCDIGVIAAAPARLNKSGMGDSLARPTAQADWLLSHLMLGTPYDAALYEPLLALEEALFASARGIAKADKESLLLLLKTLLLSGMAMTAAGGSYPASQGEHMIAHTYGMMKPTQPLPTTLHGEEVGVATLTMAHWQEEMLEKKAAINREPFDAQEMKKLFGNKVTKEAEEAFAEKQALIPSPIRGEDGRGASVANTQQVSPHPNPPPNGEEIKDWQDIAGQIERVIIPSVELQQVLIELEAPLSPQMLGWSLPKYEIATGAARFMRNRFTFLDLV